MFSIFKGFLILTEFGKLVEFGSKIRQICQLSLNFGKTRLSPKTIRKIPADVGPLFLYPLNLGDLIRN